MAVAGLDRFQLNATSAIHLTADAQFAQYFEIRAGQYRVGGRLVSAPD